MVQIQLIIERMLADIVPIQRVVERFKQVVFVIRELIDQHMNESCLTYL